MPEVLAYACDDAATQVHRTTITVPEPGPHDVCMAASAIDGIAETQEVLDFCAEHGVHPQVEAVPAGASEPQKASTSVEPSRTSRT